MLMDLDAVERNPFEEVSQLWNRIAGLVMRISTVSNKGLKKKGKVLTFICPRIVF